MSVESKSRKRYRPTPRRAAWIVWTTAASLLLLGWFLANSYLLGLGGLLVAAALVWRMRRPRNSFPADYGLQSAVEASRDRSSALDESDLGEKLLREGRHALLLRPGIAELLEPEILARAVDQLERQQAIVPGGQVVVGPLDEAIQEGKLDADSISRSGARVIEIEPVFLDRHPVTNAEYQAFVAAGGYEDMAIWDEQIWPEIGGLVDRTGEPGPRDWRHGKFPAGQARFPVVGINWYEANAFARWVGKRLPSDAEWVKASAWPLAPRPGIWLQRRYPWGDSFDHRKANLWGSGPDAIVDVDQFDDGVTAGGIHQMVGNVWEWTASGFGRPDDVALTLPVPMKSIRGGAFDTYFENQATCHFDSGENPYRRRHNIGVRLAIGMCDLAPVVWERLGLAGDREPLPEDEEVCA